MSSGHDYYDPYPSRVQVDLSRVQWTDFSNVQYFQQSDSEEDKREGKNRERKKNEA